MPKLPLVQNVMDKQSHKMRCNIREIVASGFILKLVKKMAR